MNLLKTMEAIAIALALSLSASAFAKVPAATVPTVANNTKMIKVLITGKRLSPAQKAQLAAL